MRILILGGRSMLLKSEDDGPNNEAFMFFYETGRTKIVGRIKRKKAKHHKELRN